MYPRERKGTRFLGRVSARRVGTTSKNSLVALRTAKRLQMSSQRDHFPQHAKAVAEKTNFTAFGMVPPRWNFADPQTGPMREIKQLDVEGEAFDARRFKNRSEHLEAKRFKYAF